MKTKNITNTLSQITWLAKKLNIYDHDDDDQDDKGAKDDSMASSTSVAASAICRASTSLVDFVQRSKRTTPIEPTTLSSLALIFNAFVSSNFISSVELSIPTLFSLGLDLAVSLVPPFSPPQNFLASQIVRDSRIGYRWCFWFSEVGECRRSL